MIHYSFIHRYNMKKTAILLTLGLMSVNTFAIEQFSTYQLSSMDCPSLAVEKANSKRALEKANAQISNLNAQAQAPTNSVSKWASLAGGALSAFSGNSKSAAKAADVAHSLSGNDQTEQVAGNLEYYELIQSNAQSNVDNITIYQDAKKCK